MLAVRLILAALVLPPLAIAIPPAYSLASVVHSATGQPGSFAPNSMVTIYGTALAYGTEAVSTGQTLLPRTLAGVQVNISGGSAYLFYVSPQQINFIMPPTLLPGPVTLFVAREGVSGPVLTVTLAETAPGFFATDTGEVIGTHADGRLITDNAPAVPDEVIVLYCAGLGRTNPEADPGRASVRAAPILLLPKLVVLLGGTAVDTSRVLYAGITPGFAGLYQINLRIPTGVTANPEVRVFIGQQGSPSFVKLPVQIQ